MAIRTSQIGGLMAALMMFSITVEALPFAPIEPKSFAMGGAGVASASNSSAVVLNPALLAVNEKNERIEISFPVLGYRLGDTEKMLDALSYYQDNGLEAAYDMALDNFKNASGTLQAIIAAGNALGQRLALLADKPVQVDKFAGLVVGVPQQTVNMSLSLSTRVVGGAQVDVSNTDLSELLRVVNAAGDGSLADTESFDSTQFASKMRGRGLIMTELGLSLAREFRIAGHEIAIGVTPKYMDVTSIDYAVDLNDGGSFKTNLGQKDHSVFDMDVGVAKHYDSGWGVGMSVKNLIGQRYETSLGNIIRIKPQARIGVAHATQWTRTVLDLDLNESDSLGFDSKSQYLAIGSELNVFEKFRVRIGYRHNMADTNTSIVTTGLGWQLFGGELDFAAGANEDEIAYAADYCIQF